MNNSYEDILERLGEPQWFDENGVPRYCVFGPHRCGVYVQYVALIEVACQDCGVRFSVASVAGRLEPVRLPSPEDSGSFHYGDPPIHGCIGDTMNVESVRVVEFWRRDGDGWAEWRRDRELEIDWTDGHV